jgi:AraC-like DNA-binding protein
LDGKIFEFEVQQFVDLEIQIGQVKYNCHIEHSGTSPNDMWTFILPGKRSSMFKFNHTMIDSTSSILIFSPGSKINGVSYDGFHAYAFSIQQSYFQKILQKYGLDIEEKLFEIDRIKLKPEHADKLRNRLVEILTSVASLEYEMISIEEKNLLFDFLSLKFVKKMVTYIDDADTTIIKEKNALFLDIRAYMHEHSQEMITIEEIAKKFHISERTLRCYFNEEINMSPKQYLTALRLRKIRDELKELNMEKGLVEKTARKFCFYHMAQFSKVYKKIFNESPSDTLKRI